MTAPSPALDNPAEVLPATLPEPIAYRSRRAFVRKVLAREVDLRAVGTQFVPSAEEPENGPSARYRKSMNRAGSPSENVAESYRWEPGTELVSFASSVEGRAK